MRVTFDGMRVKGNKATLDGGGIYNSSSGDFLVINSTIESNTGTNGGGFANAPDADLIIRQSTIMKNVARFPGYDDAQQQLDGGEGGGFWSKADGDALIENVTISGNFAAIRGGGLFHDADGKLHLVNLTITRNSAPVGGGIGVVESDFAPEVPPKANESVVLRNTIVAESVRGGSCDWYVTSEGGNLSDAGVKAPLRRAATRRLRRRSRRASRRRRRERTRPRSRACATASATRSSTRSPTTAARRSRTGSCARAWRSTRASPRVPRRTSAASRGRRTTSATSAPSSTRASRRTSTSSRRTPSTTRARFRTRSTPSPSRSTARTTRPRPRSSSSSAGSIEHDPTELPEPIAPWEPIPPELQWLTCSSPYSVPPSEEGFFTFEVRAIDRTGNIDPTPDVHPFSGADTQPPETIIVEHPPNPSFSRTGTFSFTATDNITPRQFMEYECRIDTRDPDLWLECFNPAIFSNLTTGEHTVEVRAYDSNENVDPTPARYKWIVGEPQDCNAANITLTAVADGMVDQVNPGENYVFLTELVGRVERDRRSDRGPAGAGHRREHALALPLQHADRRPGLHAQSASSSSGTTRPRRRETSTRRRSPSRGWRARSRGTTSPDVIPGATPVTIGITTDTPKYMKWDVTDHVNTMLASGVNYRLADQRRAGERPRRARPDVREPRGADRPARDDAPAPRAPLRQRRRSRRPTRRPWIPGRRRGPTSSAATCITEDTILGDDIGPDCLGEGLVIGAPNIVLDLNGHWIDGPDYLINNISGQEEGFPAGIRNAGHSNVLITNSKGGDCINALGEKPGCQGGVKEFGYGVLLAGTTFNVVENLHITINAMAGVELQDADDGANGNTVRKNYIHDNELGVTLLNDSYGSLIEGNKLHGNLGEAVLIEFSDGHTIKNNEIVGVPFNPQLDSDGGMLLHTASRQHDHRQHPARHGRRRHRPHAGLGLQPDRRAAGRTWSRSGPCVLDASARFRRGQQDVEQRRRRRLHPGLREQPGHQQRRAPGVGRRRRHQLGERDGHHRTTTSASTRTASRPRTRTTSSSRATTAPSRSRTGSRSGTASTSGSSTTSRTARAASASASRARPSTRSATRSAPRSSPATPPTRTSPRASRSRTAAATSSRPTAPTTTGATASSPRGTSTAAATSPPTTAPSRPTAEPGAAPAARLRAVHRRPLRPRPERAAVRRAGHGSAERLDHGRPRRRAAGPDARSARRRRWGAPRARPRASTSRPSIRPTRTEGEGFPLTALVFSCRLDPPPDIVEPVEPVDPDPGPPDPGGGDVSDQDPYIGEGWGECIPPVHYHNLEAGIHRFEVMVEDQNSPDPNADLTPAVYYWEIDLTAEEDPNAGNDTKAPDTFIVRSPDEHTIATNALFRFSGSDNMTPGLDLTYECRHYYDSTVPDPYEPLAAIPATSRGRSASHRPSTRRARTRLGQGRHRFEVRAIDGSDNVDQSPAAHSWNILEPPEDTTAPVVTIKTGPDPVTVATSATFTFTADEPGVTYECSLLGQGVTYDFSDCTSPRTYPEGRGDPG